MENGVQKAMDLVVAAALPMEETSAVGGYKKVPVTNVDEAGTVALLSWAPKVGVPLTAMLSRPRGGEMDPKWQYYHRRPNAYPHANLHAGAGPHACTHHWRMGRRTNSLTQTEVCGLSLCRWSRMRVAAGAVVSE